jgi:hypothetical protein
VRSEFFLFGYLKEKTGGISFTTSDDLIFATGHNFSEILEIGLKNVLTNWITRVPSAIKKGGEYYTKKLEKNRIILIAENFFRGSGTLQLPICLLMFPQRRRCLFSPFASIFSMRDTIARELNLFF